MLITNRYLKTLEQIETSKIRQQIIINQCDKLERVLNQAIESSNQRLKLFNKKEESNYAHHSRNLTRIEHQVHQEPRNY